MKHPISIGDEVTLVCPIPCDDTLLPLVKGTVVYCYQGDEVFEVRFPGGRIATVTRIEFTEH